MQMLGATAIAAALAMTTITSCSSEIDNSIEEQPVEVTPGQEGVKITVSAGIDDGDATTRSEVEYNTTTKIRTLKFTTGDRLYVYGAIRDDVSFETWIYTYLAGYLNVSTIGEDGKSATFTGTLYTYRYNDNTHDYQKVAYDFGDDDPLSRCNNSGGVTAYLIHNGIKSDVYDIKPSKQIEFYDDKMFADNVEALMTTALEVQGSYTNGAFSLSSNRPIFNCTFNGLEASHDYTATLNTDDLFIYDYPFTTDKNGVGTIAIASRPDVNYSSTRSIIIKDGDNEVYTIDLGTRKFGAKIYNVTRQFVNLANITNAYTAQDGEILIGQLGDDSHFYKLSIADGATVTLASVTIPGRIIDGDEYYYDTKWAGITCEGDATIILSGENNVTAFYYYHPAIQPGPTGTTLTIKGTGSLNATGQTYSAGIGAGSIISCGNICIEGGTITATGGSHISFLGLSDTEGNAGIGASYYADCGDITITGGTITAIGGIDAAGIGAGFAGDCGDITITTGVTKVTASRQVDQYTSVSQSIGHGYRGLPKTITIGGKVYDWENNLQDDKYLSQNPLVYEP